MSANLGVTIDTAAPAAPTSAPDLQAASDSGFSDTDNITNDNTPAFNVDVGGSPYFVFCRDGVSISGYQPAGATYTAPRRGTGRICTRQPLATRQGTSRR